MNISLANNGEDKMRADTSVEKDILARILLLNIEIDNKKEPVFLWKEPFDALLKLANVNSGARLAEDYKPIYAVVEYIIEHPNYRPDFKVPECKDAIVEGGFKY